MNDEYLARVIEVVKENGMKLMFMSARARRNKKVVLCAVAQCGDAIEFAGVALRNNKRVVMTAIANSDINIVKWYASERLKKDRDVVLAQVSRGCANHFAYMDESVRFDREFAMSAVIANAGMLRYVGDVLQNDREFVLSAVIRNGEIVRHLPQHLKDDYEVALSAVINCGNVITFVCNAFKNDRKLLLAGLSTLRCGKSVIVDTDEIIGSSYMVRTDCYETLNEVFHIDDRYWNITREIVHNRFNVRGYLLLDVVVCLRLSGW